MTKPEGNQKDKARKTSQLCPAGSSLLKELNTESVSGFTLHVPRTRNTLCALRNTQYAPRRCESTCAFSLIEVMIAVLILGVALVGFVQGTTTAITSSKDSEIQTTAVLLASGRIEKLRAEGELEDGESDGDWAEDFPNYSWKQSIAPTEIKGLHDITLTIENPKTGKQLYELRTMLFEPPPVQEEETTGKTSKSKKKKQKGAQE